MHEIPRGGVDAAAGGASSVFLYRHVVAVQVPEQRSELSLIHHYIKK